MKTKVVLHGALATAVGRSEWVVKIASPAEALRAIEANTGKVLDYFYENLESEYRFVIDGRDVTDFSELQLGVPLEMHILPVLKGSSNAGGWLAIIGLVIVGLVAWWSAPAWIGPLAATTTLTGAQSFFLTVGVALTLAGVSQMLAPTPKVDNVEKPENKPSYIFNGAVNTYRQGNPIPVGFGGPFRIGSQVISAGIRSVDIIDEL